MAQRAAAGSSRREERVAAAADLEVAARVVAGMATAVLVVAAGERAAGMVAEARAVGEMAV